MPVIFRGSHICEYCKNVYDWVNFELTRSRLNRGSFRVEKIPFEPKVHRADVLDDGKYRIEINCPKCGKFNIFEYNKEKEDNV